MKKRMLALLLTLVMVLGLFPTGAFAAGGELPFQDLEAGAWYLEAVRYAYETGMMNGTGENTFSPDGSATRATLVTLLHRMEKTPPARGEAFSDVAEGAWYAPAVAWASANGIVKGVGDGSFRPDDVLTREQFATILYRYARYKGVDVSGAGDLSSFPDADTVSDFAKEAMAWAVKTGLITGTGEGRLDPIGGATRAQAAAILMRYEKTNGTAPAATATPAPTATATPKPTRKPGGSGSSGGSGSGSNPDPTNTPTPTDTPAPTETPAPEEKTILIETISDISLNIGEGKDVVVETTPDDAILTAKSGNEDIAMVTVSGHTLSVTAVAAGTAAITVTAQRDGYKSAEVTFDVTGGFILYNGTVTLPVLMDAHYDENDTISTRTYTQIVRAVGDFRQDVAMVTEAIDYKEIQQLFEDNEDLQAQRLEEADQSKVPALIYEVPQGTTYENAVIVGAIGESDLIDGLIADGKLDEAKDILGNWEAYVIKEVEAPVPGVEKALVIAGSDARGTIYGIYTVSEKIGVSPFYWYSDVAVETKDKIAVDYATALVDDGPAVRYRGIFINDEEHAIEWANAKFKSDGAAPGVNYYRRVFEMMLRLKGNTLWPAMHYYTTAFNTKVDENNIPINAKEAAKYGIIMGTSHCEIFLRNNEKEWDPWIRAHKSEYDGASNTYDVTINEAAIMGYWKERLETNKEFESILTIGTRGKHDEKPTYRGLSKYPGKNDDERKVNMMKDIITKQREMIAEVYQTDPRNVPQVLITYKEVNDIYNAGLKDFMAWDGSEDFNKDGKIDWHDDNSDVILMWAENNQNYLRQPLTPNEQKRPGGGGVYYHSSVYGAPRSYLWTNEIQLSVMSEQMLRAYDTGSDDYWIVNVGDIKPGELPMELFIKLGWDPETYNDKTIESKFLTEQAKRDYYLSDEDAAKMAAAMNEFYQLVGTMKPSFFNINDDETRQFNVAANGDEGMRFVERCNVMVDTMTEIYEKLPEESKTGFYQLAYYNAMAMRDAAEEHIYYQKNQMAAEQGRYGSSTVYAQLGQEAGQRIDQNVKEYNNQNGGKWPRMMQLVHGGGRYERIEEKYYTRLITGEDGVGAACENQTEHGAGTLRFNSVSPDDQRYFDVFDKNNVEESWVAETSADWIVLSQNEGKTGTEQRVLVSVDWSKLDTTADGRITVYNVGDTGEKADAVAAFDVKAVRFDGYGDETGYVAANGYAAIEAEHYTSKVDGSDGSYWAPVVSNAQHGDTMKALPSGDHHTEDWAATAQLHYSVYFDKAGTYQFALNRLPTENDGKTQDGVDRSANVAVGVGSAAPTVLKGTRNNSNWNDVQNNTPWGMNIIRQYEFLECDIQVEQGWNDIVLYRVDSDIVVDRMIVRSKDADMADAAPVGLLGPWESPNNIPSANTEPTHVGPLPKVALDNYYILPNVDMTEKTTEVKSAEGLEAVEVLDSNVVTAEAVTDTDGSRKLKITALRPGVTRIKVMAVDGREGSITVSVVTSADGSGVYEEADGQVVFNAADALCDGKYIYHSDCNNGIHTWQLLGAGLQVLPDTNKDNGKWVDASLNALQGKAPTLTYTVQINTPGNYYLYTNMSNPNRDGDSYHAFVDEEFWYTTDSMAVPSGAYRWYHENKAFYLSEGLHTITIFAREDGLAVNQFVLSMNGDLAVEGLLESKETVLPPDRVILGKLKDVELVEGGKSQKISLSVFSTNEKQVTVTAESSAEQIVTATVNSDQIELTPIGEGSAEITITATAEGCKKASGKFTVRVQDAVEGKKAYLPNEQGIIVINAVDAMTDSVWYTSHSNENASGKYSDIAFTWKTQKESGESGTSLQLLPVAGPYNKMEWTDNGTTTTPSLMYKVWVPEDGKYYLSVFSNAPNNTSDSFHFGVNSEWAFASKDQVSNGVDKWGATNGPGWFYYDAGDNSVQLTKGYNTIHIWARESGILLRQFMLSPEKQTGLTDWQTASTVDVPAEDGSSARKKSSGAVVIDPDADRESGVYASEDDTSLDYAEMDFQNETGDRQGAEDPVNAQTRQISDAVTVDNLNEGDTKEPRLESGSSLQNAMDFDSQEENDALKQSLDKSFTLENDAVKSKEQ